MTTGGGSVAGVRMRSVGCDLAPVSRLDDSGEVPSVRSDDHGAMAQRLRRDQRIGFQALGWAAASARLAGHSPKVAQQLASARSSPARIRARGRARRGGKGFAEPRCGGACAGARSRQSRTPATHVAWRPGSPRLGYRRICGDGRSRRAPRCRAEASRSIGGRVVRNVHASLGQLEPSNIARIPVGLIVDVFACPPSEHGLEPSGSLFPNCIGLGARCLCGKGHAQRIPITESWAEREADRVSQTESLSRRKALIHVHFTGCYRPADTYIKTPFSKYHPKACVEGRPIEELQAEMFETSDRQFRPCHGAPLPDVGSPD